MVTDGELLASHPAKVVVWLDEWQKQGKKISLDSEINWIGLAECAAAKVCDINGKQTALESMLWGSVAITIREELAKNGHAGRDSAMWVRHNLIAMFGNQPGDPICDSKIILDWFYQQLPMALQEAILESQNWHTNPSARRFEFKLIIERLRGLKSLVDASKLDTDQELRRWLEILASVDNQA